MFLWCPIPLILLITPSYYLVISMWIFLSFLKNFFVMRVLIWFHMWWISLILHSLFIHLIFRDNDILYPLWLVFNTAYFDIIPSYLTLTFSTWSSTFLIIFWWPSWISSSFTFWSQIVMFSMKLFLPCSIITYISSFISLTSKASSTILFISSIMIFDSTLVNASSHT